MNARLRLSASVIVIGGLAIGIAAGCAGTSMSKTGSGDVVAERQRLMKLQGARLFTQYGRPLAIYGDRINILVRNDAHWSLAEQLRGAQSSGRPGLAPGW